MKRLGTSITLLLLTAGAAHAQMPASYTLTDVGNLGQQLTHGVGINNSDQIVGTSMEPSNDMVPYIWNGVINDLSATTSPPYPFTQSGAGITGINASGQVSQTLATSNSTGYRPGISTLYTVSPTTLPSGYTGSMIAINDLGTGLGAATNSSTGASFWFTTISGGGYSPLTGLSSGDTLRAMNAMGQYAGHSASPSSPMLYSGGVKYPFGIPGGVGGYGIKINSLGEVLAWSGTTGGGTHSFIFRPWVPNGTSGRTIDLGFLPGAISAVAMDMNSFGEAVGQSGNHAFLYVDGTMHDLNNYVTGLPVGVTIWMATAINDKGTIACEAGPGSGAIYTYELTPHY